MKTLHTILHPTDFSTRSDEAFRLACSLARDHRARLVLLHVVPPPVAHGEVVARRQDDSYYDELRQGLERMRPEASELAVTTRLEDGDPAREIVRVAEDEVADMIVMGTHGRSGLGRILLGSVAEQVMRIATCPVLTVKAPWGHPILDVEPPPREAVAASAPSS